MTVVAACGGGGGGEPVRAVTAVTVSSPTLTLKQGDTVQLTAVARDQFGDVMPGTTASWSTSAPSVATVSATGLLQAMAGGTVSATATVNGVPGTLTLTITPRVTTTVTVGSPTASPSVGETVQLTVVARDQFGDVLAGKTATWSTSDANVATISPTGLLQALTPGSVVVTASTNGVSGALTLTIVPGCVAVGDIDTTFATNGMYVYPRGLLESGVAVRQILTISPGRLLALGRMGAGPTSNSPFRPAASFALTDTGALDGTFGQGGLLPEVTASAHELSAARQLVDGSLVLASQALGCSSPGGCVIDPGPTYRVQRHLSTGVLDTSYAQAGTHATASHLGNAAILSDGTAVGLGATYARSIFLPDNRPYSFHAIVVDAAGQSNPTLAERFLAQMIRCSPSGTADVSSVSPKLAPVVQRDGDDRIFFAYGSCMLKLNPDATPDGTFGSDGRSSVDDAGLHVQQVLILEDGRILTFSLLADGSSYRVVRRLPNGSPDPTFGVDGVLAAMTLPFEPFGTPGSDMFYWSEPNTRGFPALDRHGRVLIAGTDPASGSRVSYLARFDAGMNLDTSFGTAGTGVVALGDPALGRFVPLTVAIDDLDRIVLGGALGSADASSLYGTRYAEAVTRLNAAPFRCPSP